MAMPQTVRVNVKGNFSGNLVVGNHNIVVNNPDGGVVNVTAPHPQSEPRTRPVNLRPRDFSGLLDRTAELELLTTAVQTSSPVTLFGESGMGKTSLLRKASYIEATKNFPDGVVYLSARETGRDDLLQDIHDAFFTASMDHKPTDGELRAKLGKLRGLIILDDVTLSRDEAASILDVMPQCVFILASEERLLWGEGVVISLDGLPDIEALQLFERELGRALKEDERPIALQICRMLLAHPLRILQTASLIREDGLSIPQAFQKLTTTRTQAPTVEMAIQRSSETQKKVFSLLAAAGGFGLTREHVMKMIPAANFDLEVQALVRRGFVQTQGSNLSLSSDAVSAVSRLWNLTDWENALAGHFTNWLQSGPQDILLDQASDLLFHLFKRVGEKKQWPQLVALGKALERISILQKKWQRWVQILNWLRMAARALADKKLEGWVLHQLGTRSLCLGAKVEAQTYLKQALDVRNAIGDKAGVQVTQHNLNVLLNIPVPEQYLKSGSSKNGSTLARWVTLAAVGGGAGIILLVLAFLGYQYLTPILVDAQTPDPALTETPSLTTIAIPSTVSATPRGITETPTISPTASLTPTLRPAVTLFDFVERAGDPDFAYYEYIVTNFAAPNASPSKPILLDFQGTRSDFEVPFFYIKAAELPFVTWFTSAPLEDGLTDKLALVVFLSSGNSRVRSIFNLPFALQERDEFVARVGHLNPEDLIPSDKDGVRYRLYYFENNIEDAVLLDEIPDYLDGKTHEWRVKIPEDLAGRRVRFILEVDSRTNAVYDYAAWLDAVLTGTPR